MPAHAVREEVSNNEDNTKSSYLSTGTVSNNYIDGNLEKGRHVTCVCRENLRAE
jgi:hypothetical protein